MFYHHLIICAANYGKKLVSFLKKHITSLKKATKFVLDLKIAKWILKLSSLNEQCKHNSKIFSTLTLSVRAILLSSLYILPVRIGVFK